MFRETSAVALLVALVVVVFALGWQRTSSERWQLPTRYSGDDVHSLALLKAARDGHLVPIVPLRVPELARSRWRQLERLPASAQAPVACRRCCWPGCTGLWFASNLMLLGAHLLSALSFYGVARHLRTRREWAAAGALLFAFAPFMFWRGFGHLTVAACWPIPLALLALAWCTSRRRLRPAKPSLRRGLCHRCPRGLAQHLLRRPVRPVPRPGGTRASGSPGKMARAPSSRSC